MAARPPLALVAAVAAAAAVAVLLAAGPVGAETACQSARRTDQRSSNPYVIHECDEQGNYQPKQQTVGTPHWYWCYTPDGDVMMGPSRKIQTCACPVAQHRIRADNRANKKAAAEPQCDPTGHFTKEQADREHRWCVHPATGAVTKAKVPKAQTLSCQ